MTSVIIEKDWCRIAVRARVYIVAPDVGRTGIGTPEAALLGDAPPQRAAAQGGLRA
ncbi:hypothetical protein OHA40_03125 [Nocardia sp. NBC_00508]|uniref:hypothetical protein n=1 Tax=Nocardia sp. NBC_00508 TaxID=2975992 RepID=UPI002E8229B3|nr:hypothetical protein [Nocardia sp. NBC_00508]WUD67169.1 hypothetical protein OHA40_03125 [Nocardia sp. NBC_00508]